MGSAICLSVTCHQLWYIPGYSDCKEISTQKRGYFAWFPARRDPATCKQMFTIIIFIKHLPSSKFTYLGQPMVPENLRKPLEFDRNGCSSQILFLIPFCYSALTGYWPVPRSGWAGELRPLSVSTSAEPTHASHCTSSSHVGPRWSDCRTFCSGISPHALYVQHNLNCNCNSNCNYYHKCNNY